MWKTTPTELFERRITRFLKKHAREAKAALDNLDMYFSLLQKGTKPGAIKVGFTHNEPSGVKAIDQKGGGKALAQTRLYVFPEEEVETLHLITIGDKNSQKADIADCRDFMKSLQQTKI